MPVPATIDDLSTTASSNSPAGGETPKDGDNYLRSLSGFIAELRDKLDGTSNTGTIKNATFSGTMAGAASWSALQTFAAGISTTTVTASGAVTGSNIVATPSGTYTPTYTAGTNITGSTHRKAQWSRAGNVVTVSGAVTLTATASNTASQFYVTLPVASNLSTAYDLIGGAGPTGAGATALTASIVGDAANDRALVSLISSAMTFVACYWFQYEVI